MNMKYVVVIERMGQEDANDVDVLGPFEDHNAALTVVGRIRELLTDDSDTVVVRPLNISEGNQVDEFIESL
jgi:hypothetical protein